LRILAALLCTFAAWGQIGGSRYPQGGGVPGVPLPGRGKKQSSSSKSKEPAQVLPNFTGRLQRIDAKALVLEMGDARELEFRRTDKTRFLKKGEEAKPEIFKVGDEVSIEASEDAERYLTAVNVHWEKSGAPAASKAPADASAPAGPPAEAAAAGPAAAVYIEPKPAPADPDDSGPPRLQRGKPPARPTAAEPPAEAPLAASAAAAQPAVVAPSDMKVERLDGALPARQEDALIRRAQDTALEFTETLPNYVCQQMIARYQSETTPANWRAVDLVSSEVVYEKGKEDYRNIAINGKPVKKKMEEIGGSWSTGEFGSILVDLLSPATSADFRFRRESRAGGVTARMYDFEVARENSHWTVKSGAQTYRPAYRGSVWVDPKTARVLRIEMQARGLPEEFPLDKVESATDYEYVRLGATQQFLLPVHSEVLSCGRGTSLCSRNAIDFRNYHKYAGQSTVQFEK
jgi:hypothetical protein